jgi:hypothetical protein
VENSAAFRWGEARHAISADRLVAALNIFNSGLNMWYLRRLVFIF